MSPGANDPPQRYRGPSFKGAPKQGRGPGPINLSFRMYVCVCITPEQGETVGTCPPVPKKLIYQNTKTNAIIIM